MKPNQSPQDHFAATRSKIYNELKAAYNLSVEKAADKNYAQAFYRQLYFVDNSGLPHFSVAYHNLINTHNHFRKLDPENEIELTLKLWPDIIKVTERFYTSAMQAHLFDNDSLQLHFLYLEGMERGLSLEEIVLQEQQVLGFTDQQLIELLALNDAATILSDEFCSEPEIEEETCDEDFLRRHHQVLITYYVGKILGVYHDKKVTRCAKALHRFLQLPYSDLPNSDLYKKLLHPIANKPSTIQNLILVRQFFEDLGLPAAVAMIDEDLMRLTAGK